MGRRDKMGIFLLILLLVANAVMVTIKITSNGWNIVILNSFATGFISAIIFAILYDRREG